MRTLSTTVVATYSDDWWDNVCEECGATIDDDAFGYGGRATCPACGHRGVPEPAAVPSSEGGFANPYNPWGDVGANVVGNVPRETWEAERAAYSRTVTLWEAAELAAEFPGGVWEAGTDCESEQDARTGRWRRVTLHIDDHAETVLALAALIGF